MTRLRPTILESMAVLIDAPRWPAHGRLWGHLVSDQSLTELHEFATELGLPRRAFDRDHYDYPEHLYDEAVSRGAAPVSRREMVHRLTSSGLRVRAPRRASRSGPLRGT